METHMIDRAQGIGGRMGKVASGFADVERHLTMTPDSRMLRSGVSRK
jgi:hypothetical protein